MLIECCEESGSLDLPAYIDLLAERIGTPRLVICLDSGCGNYDQLWMTTSLRGSIVGNLTVEVLTEGVHSGDASGIVPSSFRIIRMLLDRLEDATTGNDHPGVAARRSPRDAPRRKRRKRPASSATRSWNKFPFVAGMQPVTKDPLEALLNRTWRPALAYTGQAGFPDLVQGGNVLRPKTSIKLSLRIPPSLDATDLERKLKELLESDPPYGAKVSFEPEKGGARLGRAGDRAVARAVRRARVADVLRQGRDDVRRRRLDPVHGDARRALSRRRSSSSPASSGPHSNAHGPNEFLHIDYAKRLTACVAQVLARRAQARA